LPPIPLDQTRKEVMIGFNIVNWDSHDVLNSSWEFVGICS